MKKLLMLLVLFLAVAALAGDNRWCLLLWQDVRAPAADKITLRDGVQKMLNDSGKIDTYAKMRTVSGGATGNTLTIWRDQVLACTNSVAHLTQAKLGTWITNNMTEPHWTKFTVTNCRPVQAWADNGIFIPVNVSTNE